MYTPLTLNCRGRLLSIEEPIVMGILNVTPDSFYDGGQFLDLEQAQNHAFLMIEQGAKIIDIGGMTSKPGSKPISVQEEIDRILPIVELLISENNQIILSLDTYRSEVAKAGLEAGISIINDISACMIDPDLAEVVAYYKAPYILMHMQNKPENMQLNPIYTDVTVDVLDFLNERIAWLHNKGIWDIVVDPGFGFGKTVEHSYTLLNELSAFKITGCPILAGVSHKSMINKVLEVPVKESIFGTTAVEMVALLNGASIIRTHNVVSALQCIKLLKYVNP